MRIIFMGTSAFAVPALDALIDSEHEVIAVYTQPPRPAGRGKKLKKSPVHEIADSEGITVKTPETFKDDEDIEQFIALGADAAVVASYGLLLPKEVLEGCKHGCINIHPSLLPRWRGAAPINRTIMAGDKETGVCIIQMVKKLDAGDILTREKIPLEKEDDAGSLHDELAEIGANLLIHTLNLIEKGEATPKKQDSEGVTYAKKLSKKESKIDWNNSAQKVDCLIRGLNPWPGVYFVYNNEKIKIIQAKWDKETFDVPPGTVIDDKLTIACTEGNIQPLTVQREGKKPITTHAFLRGFLIPTGSLLE